ncbi:MAG: DUF3768 domain-containing protein [Flavobacteriaceae bacterium]|nr:DUF3768 domain-containing protein [Flavobacteriaceae bacterium]
MTTSERQLWLAHNNRISMLNDEARRTFTGCELVLTSGIDDLLEKQCILDHVREYDEFTIENDPYEEHNF